MYHVSFCEQHHEDKPGQHKLPTIKKCVATIRANTPGQTKIAANSFNLMPKNRLLYAPTLSHIYQLRNPIRRERPPKQVGFQGPSLPLPPPPGQSPPPPSTQPPTLRLMGPTGCMCHKARLLHESPACAAAHRCSGDVVDEGGRAVRSQRWMPAVQQCCGRWSVGLMRWALEGRKTTDYRARGIHNSRDAV